MATKFERFHLIMYLDLLGKPLGEISALLSLRTTDVDILMSSPLYRLERKTASEQLKLALLRDTVDRIVAETDRSLRVLVDIRDDPISSRTLRAKIAQDFLDRVPETSKTLRAFKGLVQQPSLTDEQLLRLTAALGQDELAKLAAMEDQYEVVIEMEMSEDKDFLPPSDDLKRNWPQATKENDKNDQDKRDLFEMINFDSVNS